ncbi:hypothetical protein O1611_g10073 [Lasiodiplodia mahajangana]|uniref:Uncharacterized protein n=1 Tax=Lasiodiplodia mahajangana TaxID=1108764 RepID=A0ACC2J2A8_9PEZI|nr:hypothetical protein O1611_g10073 [Lasiodiplodia mahajangana]
MSDSPYGTKHHAGRRQPVRRDIVNLAFDLGAGDRDRDPWIVVGVRSKGAILAIESSLQAQSMASKPQSTGERIPLPANRPLDRKPAYSILMAATRADPGLPDEEFLSVVSEICVHPHMRGRGNGTRLMRHIMGMADVLGVKIIVLVEGSVSEAARQWVANEAEEVNGVELVALEEGEQRTTMPFYEDKLGFKKRAYFFWGRQGSAIPRIFHIMQYPAGE